MVVGITSLCDKHSNEHPTVTPLIEKPFHIEVGLLLPEGDCLVPSLCFN